MKKALITPWHHALFPDEESDETTKHYADGMIFGIKQKTWEHISLLPREVVKVGELETLIKTRLKPTGRQEVELYIPNEFIQEIT